jgi:hypothetical protein
MYSLRWLLYLYMGRGLENEIPAYTLILCLCLPVDVSELKLWTYTSWSYNIIIIYIQWVLYKSNNTIKMSLYNWGFVVRQRNRSWWKFRRGNFESYRFLITKNNNGQAFCSKKPWLYNLWSWGYDSVNLFLDVTHMYRGTMLVLDLLPQFIFKNHVQVIPEIYVYHTQPSPMPLTSSHHHHHHHHPLPSPPQ